jgi:hypothetical protein
MPIRHISQRVKGALSTRLKRQAENPATARVNLTKINCSVQKDNSDFY